MFIYILRPSGLNIRGKYKICKEEIAITHFGILNPEGIRTNLKGYNINLENNSIQFRIPLRWISMKIMKRLKI